MTGPCVVSASKAGARSPIRGSREGDSFIEASSWFKRARCSACPWSICGSQSPDNPAFAWRVGPCRREHRMGARRQAGARTGWAFALVLAAAADWPVHRGDAGLRGVAAWGPEPPLRRVWSARVAEASHSSPVIAGGRVFVGSDSNALVALDLESGAPLWTAPADAPVDAPPLAAGDRVLAATERGGVLCGGGPNRPSLLGASARRPRRWLAESGRRWRTTAGAGRVVRRVPRRA